METFRQAPLSLVALAMAIGCGDLTNSEGEQGRLRFSLATDYELEQDELTDALIVAGHKQRLDVELTSKGDEDIGEPDEITFRLDPAKGTDVDTMANGENEPPDLSITVQEPGRYSLGAIYKGRVVDTIALSFDKPDSLELSLKIRKPFDDSFDDVREPSPIPVVEGTQATFLPIPKKGKQRLAGEISTEVSASPKELVVPGAGASFVYEQDVWSAEGNVDFYFIDPGTVTITLSDPISKASGSYTFEVSDASAP